MTQQLTLDQKKERANAVIDYVLEYIEKNGRALNISGRCLYLTSEGKRCGHSICIKDDFLDSHIDELNGLSAVDVLEEFGDNIHKEEFRGLDISFWEDIQEFHDETSYWRPNNSLSTEGKIRLKGLKAYYEFV